MCCDVEDVFKSSRIMKIPVNVILEGLRFRKDLV